MAINFDKKINIVITSVHMSSPECQSTTIVNRIQRMILFDAIKINILRILITFIYGAIDELYAFFKKIEIIFFHAYYIQ